MCMVYQKVISDVKNKKKQSIKQKAASLKRLDGVGLTEKATSSQNLQQSWILQDWQLSCGYKHLAKIPCK